MSLSFPASQIQEFKDSIDEFTEQQKLELFVNFMGMVGVSGVMPIHYTELIMERVRYRDTAMWTFLDIFTHRSVSMFFRAWEKYRFPIGYERGQDDFTAFLFDIAGLGTRGLRGQMVWNTKLLKVSFWCLNVGLALMAALTLLPLGTMQLFAAIEHGYAFARSADFMQRPIVKLLIWMRVPGDTIFSVGALSLAWFVLRLWVAPKRDPAFAGEVEREA